MNSNAAPDTVAIVNVWSDHNRGDAAIVQATCRVVRDRYPDARIDLHNVVFGAAGTRLLGSDHFAAFDNLRVRLLPALFPSMVARDGRAAISQLWRVAYCLRAFLLLVVAAWKPNWTVLLTTRAEHEALDSLRRARVVLSKGGSYLLGNSWTSCLKITMVMFPLVLASIFGRPTVLLGVSVGPARSRVARWVMGFWFRWVDEFVVREDDALDTCVRLGVSRNRITLLPDLAFTLALDEPIVSDLQVVHDTQPHVAVTVRRWRFDDVGGDRSELESRYLMGVAGALSRFSGETGARIVLVPQVIGPNREGSDIGALDRLQAMISNSVPTIRLPNDLDVDTLRKVYGDVDMLVGTRLHSVILAFGTPTVIIGYQGNKSIGTARLLGLEESFLHINDVTADALYGKMDYVWRNRTAIAQRAEEQRARFRELFDKGLTRVFDRLSTMESVEGSSEPASSAVVA